MGIVKLRAGCQSAQLTTLSAWPKASFASRPDYGFVSR